MPSNAVKELTHYLLTQYCDILLSARVIINVISSEFFQIKSAFWLKKESNIDLRLEKTGRVYY